LLFGTNHEDAKTLSLTKGLRPLKSPRASAGRVELEDSSRARGFEESGARSQESEEESRIAFEYALSRRLTSSREARSSSVWPEPISPS
jgi:hypothetical protein